jgi:hypothetical protein
MKRIIELSIVMLVGVFIGHYVVGAAIGIRTTYKHKQTMDSLNIERLKLEIELKKIYLNKP